MTLGAEPKKVAMLVGLVVVAIVALYMNSGNSTSASAPHVTPGIAPSLTPSVTSTSPTRTKLLAAALPRNFGRAWVGRVRKIKSIRPLSIPS